MTRPFVLAAVTFLASGTAVADPGVHDIVVPRPPQVRKSEAKSTTNVLAGATLFVNQCTSGCNVKVGMDDSATDTSSIPGGPATLAEYAWTGTQWADLMTCVKEVYSPYNIIITDQRPIGGDYNMIYVAGSPQDVGITDNGVGGIATVATDCSPYQNGVSFAFANNGGEFAQEDDNNFVWGMCWIVAQESAHLFGLDHEYEFTTLMRSACNDPMTYRSDCGGEKFFRNADASCGEFGPARPGCGPTNMCSTTQNSHVKLLALLGPGTPITAKPMMSLQVPAANAVVKAGTAVIGTGSAQRGVATVELWINGYKWGSATGADFGQAGQPATPYTIVIPAGVPDSKLDLVLKAFDDIGIEGDSPTVSVIKGKASGCDPTVTNPDGTIDTCLKGQQCTDGKCAWTDANMGMFGDACTYDQFCTANLTCQGTATSEICTHDCDPTIMDSCPMGYECIASGTSGVCFTQQPDGGGCCNTGGAGGGLPAVVLGLGTLGLLFGRKRSA